jgi:DNA-binding beta-propeller fold protein YncE
MTIVGTGRYRYERLPAWPVMPCGWTLDNPGAAAVNSGGDVFVLSRNDHHPVTVWTQEGTFLRAWGAGQFSTMPHGIHIDGADRVWITDRDFHTVTRFTPEGTAELVLGRKLAPSPTCDGRVVKSRPFNMPTNVAVTADGEIFAADGYGNHKVHRFAADGTLQLSWGRQGTAPGTFALVHNVALDGRNRVFICDDENDRIQIFDRDGGFLAEWPFANPSGIWIRDDIVYVSELQPFRDSAIGPGRCRVSLWTLDGALLADWRGTDGPGRDLMQGGHDLCVDAAGDIYLCEGAGGHVVKFRRL